MIQNEQTWQKCACLGSAAALHMTGQVGGVGGLVYPAIIARVLYLNLLWRVEFVDMSWIINLALQDAKY